MRLHFFRHGPAVSRREWDGSDELRPLTDSGADVVRSVSRRLRKLIDEPTVILSSPYARAWQTAEILADVLGQPELLVSLRALEPGAFTADSLADALAPYPKESSIVLIGHEPSMSLVMSDLIGGGRLVLKKAGIARIDLPNGATMAGELRWLVPPSLL